MSFVTISIGFNSFGLLRSLVALGVNLHAHLSWLVQMQRGQSIYEYLNKASTCKNIRLASGFLLSLLRTSSDFYFCANNLCMQVNATAEHRSCRIHGRSSHKLGTATPAAAGKKAGPESEVRKAPRNFDPSPRAACISAIRLYLGDL